MKQTLACLATLSLVLASLGCGNMGQKTTTAPAAKNTTDDTASQSATLPSGNLDASTPGGPMFAKFLYREGVSHGPLGKPWLDFVALENMNQVWEALTALNGERLNLLIVSEAPGEPEDDEYLWQGKGMLVQGGKDNQYHCEVYNADRTSFVGIKRNATRVKEKATISIGETEVWPYQIIGIEEARTALAAFVERGEMTDALDWEKQ